jgi:FkbM family methyltransferase
MRQVLARYKRKFKKYFFLLKNQTNEYKIDVALKHDWFGNDYGGFPVYGNYLTNQSTVFSFGVGEDISFDASLFDKYKCNMFLFDPTPRSIEFIESQQLPDNFKFYSYGIGKVTGFVDFHLPANPNYVSGSLLNHKNVSETAKITVQMKSWEDICNELNIKKVDILKIDIEGSEYDVLADVLNSDVAVKQILIEFHSRYFDNGDEMTKNAIKLIKSKGYNLYSISDSLEEFGFLKKES